MFRHLPTFEDFKAKFPKEPRINEKLHQECWIPATLAIKRIIAGGLKANDQPYCGWKIDNNDFMFIHGFQEAYFRDSHANENRSQDSADDRGTPAIG